MEEYKMMKTGDYQIVDEWVKTWSEDAKNVITKNIPDYQNKIKFRTSTECPVIHDIEDTFQLIINYNSAKKCFIVWNAAIQKHIHSGKKITLSLGNKGKDKLHEIISPTSIIKFFREVEYQDSNEVELILFIGNDALENFCKNYEQMIKPVPEEIPAGKTCLYAVAGEKIEYIQSAKSNN